MPHCVTTDVSDVSPTTNRRNVEVTLTIEDCTREQWERVVEFLSPDRWAAENFMRTFDEGRPRDVAGCTAGNPESDDASPTDWPNTRNATAKVKFEEAAH